MVSKRNKKGALGGFLTAFNKKPDWFNKAVSNIWGLKEFWYWFSNNDRITGRMS